MTILKAEIARLWRALLLKQKGKVTGFIKLNEGKEKQDEKDSSQKSK